MKKMITKLLLAVTAFAVSLGFMGAPVYAYAEDGSAVSAPSTETSAGVTDDGDNEPENSVQTPTTNDSASVEETPKTDEKGENTGDIEHGFQDFLSWVEQEANRYGYGDEYASALDAIKAAATEKQVTLSTMGSFLLMAATIAYTIYNKVKDKKFKDEVAGLSTGLNKQLEKMNELVKGTNSNTKTEEEIKAEEKALKEEATKIKNALESLINGFMHFSSA
ncbi:MAG: hypothetical protein J6V88_00300, partial [Kiritimatiellae bacterium]|nr:hypothetical protein [Kiritimatiellia bacterium]